MPRPIFPRRAPAGGLERRVKAAHGPEPRIQRNGKNLVVRRRQQSLCVRNAVLLDYVTQRTLFTMKNRRASELGDIRIYTPREMLASLFAKSNVPTTIDWSELE